MARCNFCNRRFQSPQAVKAHLRFCSRYKLDKDDKSCALGTVPKAGIAPVATPLDQFGPKVAQLSVPDPMLEFVKSMNAPVAKHDEQRSPQERRRKLLQAAKEQAIDRYSSPSGIITMAMRGAAKAAIERELASLPLEELPFPEVLEFAAASRDRLYAPAFKRQVREAERQDAEKKARRRKEVEELGALIRAARRKRLFIQQARNHAHAYCDEKKIIGWEQLNVVGDIESRLDEFLTGDESIIEAQTIVRSVLDARFAEAEAKHAAARAKEDEKRRDEITGLLVLGTLVGLLALAFKYPAQALPILCWIERTFGLTQKADAGSTNHDASETTQSAASTDSRPHSRRRRKDPVSPRSPEPPLWNSVGPEQGHA